MYGLAEKYEDINKTVTFKSAVALVSESRYLPKV